MDNSDIMHLMAMGLRRAGGEHNKKYADMLDNTAATYEAQEILKEIKNGKQN